MVLRTLALAAVFSLFLASASAQTHQPYAGLQARPIKALSDDQVADLKAGRGMGLAMAAELNGYPGPMHVLELADKLHLGTGQKETVEKLFAAMKGDAVPLGQKLIDAEASLDKSFADRTITQAELDRATQAIATLQGELRVAHLKYHLLVSSLLTPEQRNRYAELRGYTGKPAAHPHKH